jgi:hypothetical protein
MVTIATSGLGTEILLGALFRIRGSDILEALGCNKAVPKRETVPLVRGKA